jgi:hypothetical protein
VATVRLRDEEVADAVQSVRRMILHPVEGATKRGADDVDRQTLEQVLRAALRPVVEAVGEVEVRLKRVEQRLAADPFGDAVTRPRPPRRQPLGVSAPPKR